MLVLTRRIGESIRIGDDIRVKVVELERGQVRLAIEAPREVPVHREEIWLQVKEANVRAADSARDSDPADLWRRRGRDPG